MRHVLALLVCPVVVAACIFACSVSNTPQTAPTPRDLAAARFCRERGARYFAVNGTHVYCMDSNLWNEGQAQAVDAVLAKEVPHR